METQTAGRRMNSQQTATLDTMTTVKGSEFQVCSNGINSQLPILIDAPLMQIPAHPNMGDDQPIYLPDTVKQTEPEWSRCLSVETKSTRRNQFSVLPE